MNVIGERQNPEKFLPRIIRQILHRKPVTLHAVGNTFSSRCWIHARNVSNALLFLLEKGEMEQTYNIVGEERDVFEIANWVCQTIQGKDLGSNDFKLTDAHSLRPGHDSRYALSGEKLKKLGRKMPVKLRKSIKKTVKWSLKNKNKHWLNL